MARLTSQRHRGFYIAIAATVLAEAVILPFERDYAVTAGANVFFLVYLAMVLPVAFRKLTADYLRKHADEEDAPPFGIFLVMIAAAAISVVSLVISLLEPSPGIGVALSGASVVLGWLAVHTMMAMHYAYEFYGRPDEGAPSARPDGTAGGLEFPGADEPDGTAFLYFSYVVGMTAQTSDTAVSSNAMRRIVTLHGIFSFFFNTVIVAGAVNIVVALAR